jgi:hypothetical protein
MRRLVPREVRRRRGRRPRQRPSGRHERSTSDETRGLSISAGRYLRLCLMGKQSETGDQ